MPIKNALICKAHLTSDGTVSLANVTNSDYPVQRHKCGAAKTRRKKQTRKLVCFFATVMLAADWCR